LLSIQVIALNVIRAFLLYKEFNKPKEAAEKLERAIEVDPEYAEAYYNYALLQEELDEPEEAAEKYERAIEHDPEYADAYYNYGLLLNGKLDKPKEAAKMYEKAIEVDPEHANAHYNYGLLLKNELDEPEEAREKMEESVSLWIDKGVSQNALHDLKALVRLCLLLNDEEWVVENCELALNILNEAPHLDTDGSERLWFESMLMVAEPDDEETVEVYRYALENVEKSDLYPAVRLFEEAWERRDEHDTDSQAHGVLVSAGVGLAAYLEILDEPKSSHDIGELLEEIDPEDLSGAQKAVYDTLCPDRDTDMTSADIERSVEQFEGLGMDEAAFEARMFAKILNLLRS